MPRNSDLLERETRSLDDELDRRPRRRRTASQPEWFDTQQAKPAKDVWDKVAAVAPIVSGALIFAMGGMCTYNYNQQQLRLQEIQTIEKFIPHLMGNEQSKRAAILAISSLTNAELAGKFAQIFASQGTVSALQSIAENGSEKEKNIAADALARAIEKSRRDIQGVDQRSSENPQFPLTLGGGSDSDEAEKLENLAQICRDRGHMAACETLLKQASLLRLKAGSNESAIITLKKLAEVQQALGSREADLTLHKIQALTEGEKSVSAPPPPVKAPVEEPSVPVQVQPAHTEIRTVDPRVDGAQASEPKLENLEDSSAQNQARP